MRAQGLAVLYVEDPICEYAVQLLQEFDGFALCPYVDGQLFAGFVNVQPWPPG